MSPRRLRLPRPDPDTPFRILVRNSQVLADWEELLRARRNVCRELWDHISTQPTTAIGSRYLPLTGPQAWVEYEGETLRQWQYEIDRRARVKVGVGKDFVVVMSVSSGHPKENE
jgi:hypothetical protein